MQFIKSFLFNLALLLVGGILLFMIFPEHMRDIMEVWGAVLGPVGILVIIIFALPRKSRR